MSSTAKDRTHSTLC